MTLAYPQCYRPVYLPLPRSLLRWGEPHRTRNILQYMNEEGCCCHIHMSHIPVRLIVYVAYKPADTVLL